MAEKDEEMKKNEVNAEKVEAKKENVEAKKENTSKKEEPVENKQVKKNSKNDENVKKETNAEKSKSEVKVENKDGKKIDIQNKVETKAKDNKKKFEPVKEEKVSIPSEKAKKEKKEKKIKKQSKGIFVRILAIIIILLVIIGLLYLAIPSPDKALNSMLQDLKTGNFEDVKKYVDYSELTSIPGTGSQESDEDGKIPAEQAENEKLLYESLEWNIKSTKKDGNVATIEIEVTNKDYKEIYKKYIQEVFSRLLTNENMSDEEAESYLIEQLKRDDIGMTTTTQTITLEKQDKNWTVKVDDNLKNLIYPGMQEAMNSISDFINAE